MARVRPARKLTPAERSFYAGLELTEHHPLFAPLLLHTSVLYGEPDGRRKINRCPPDGWAVVDHEGSIDVHPERSAAPEEWVYVLAHCLLHLGFGHFVAKPKPELWNVACDAVVGGFLAELKLGRRPADIAEPPRVGTATEEALYRRLIEEGVPAAFSGLGTSGPGSSDLLFSGRDRSWSRSPVAWSRLFAVGLSAAVSGAIDTAGGAASSYTSGRDRGSKIARARSWFISSYPLLGALASAFEVIENAELCRRMEISVAAIDDEAREIYCNPLSGLSEGEWRFVMAHELLHAGLRHQTRCQGRDPWLWNIACDYVINDWLLAMGVGTAPTLGMLVDPELKGLSAEAVYDRITIDLRRLRKLATLRGVGLPDLLPGKTARWFERGQGMDLDAFYRSALAQGLALHEGQGRSLLPAGLVEEIRALDQPALPWDVELAQWFDHHFPPRERHRTYARLSRRQSATPDIPRPCLAPLPEDAARTFAVLLDTSGSMDRKLLAKALGAIASYSVARDVGAVRLVFCDAAAYDQGYVRPEEIADRLKVKGRGGTVLQPGLELLDRARDFPERGPVLIITDGYCDVLRVRREHAYLMPAAAHLPFAAKGPIFRVR